jgi:hypothetical protein
MFCVINRHASYEVCELKSIGKTDIIKGEWNEDNHPRDDNGKFAGSGGSSGDTASDGKGVTGKYGTSKIIGKTTSTGEGVKSVSKNAVQRMWQWRVSASRVAEVLTSKDSKVEPWHTDNTKVYMDEKDGARIIFDEDSGTLVTCMFRM